ncbi:MULTISPECIES: histidine phosphatase family protein [Streptomyces]|uniref:histidine phosphatase family protein n=1 Tax=Streptomyces TaxID=1883 RepID=UPI00163CEAB8|nr:MULTISPECIES: histidine phosphatase family protein [Streptomyces]MBC2874270.1 histidine phosphatase family protein [Streptomyces sp. TYQ1024]UBI40305.1 histidine phosphatase family protein [Streptomyces mobaraensis]UKW32885.1 histidine phosphatase family protein [Streptomyces sp. TYQ1024]
MATRHVYLVRHGAADPFGTLTDVGKRQSELVGERLAGLPIDSVRHSPLPRAAHCARIVAAALPGAVVREAPELVDHIPYVPADVPPSWAAFFDGYAAEEAEDGRRRADALTARFACPAATETHEVLITHAYQVAWLVRDALDAPPVRWLGLNCGNASLTVIEYRDGTAPAVLLYNDMGHLPAELRWTGFGAGIRP